MSDRPNMTLQEAIAALVNARDLNLPVPADAVTLLEGVRCETCKWWCHRSQFVASSWMACGWSMATLTEGPKQPDFGCVRWEAK